MIDETAIESEIEGKNIKEFLSESRLKIYYFRNYDRRDYRKQGTSNYDSDESDGGNSYSSEPNNKVIVRGLAPHITEADVGFVFNFIFFFKFYFCLLLDSMRSNPVRSQSAFNSSDPEETNR